NYGPMRELFWSGQIDLWNDREFGGSSVLADIVQQPFYLGALAMRALHAPAWPGIAIRVWMHSLGGMIGMYALLRRTTSRDAAAPPVVSSLRALSSVARGAGLPREIREQWSLHPARIAELFVPRMFGPLFDQGYWGGFTVSPPWTRNYIHSIYAGMIGPGLL